MYQVATPFEIRQKICYYLSVLHIGVRLCSTLYQKITKKNVVLCSFKEI